jgi:hypothetical protein
MVDRLGSRKGDMANTYQHEDLLNERFFIEHHVEKKMSFPAISRMLAEKDIHVDQSTLSRRAKTLGIGRTRAEAKRVRDGTDSIHGVSHMDEKMIEWLDGFLLGDGHLEISSGRGTRIGRAECGQEHEEFTAYFMRGFLRYLPTLREQKHDAMKSGIVWQGRSMHHSDFYQQYLRWYPEADGRRPKEPPQDVRITPTSVMLWYLGDGSVVDNGNNSMQLRLSTDGFTPKGVEFLAQKLRDIGIACHRNNDNRVMVESRGIPAFFDFIGRNSPVKCYEYKFDLPEWRFQAKRMREVAEELGVDYQRLAHLVKTNRVPCFRASEKGKPRFMPEHVEAARHAIKNWNLLLDSAVD